MKIISWNVNGLNARLREGFDQKLAAFDADLFCVQKTKMQPKPTEFPGYTCIHNPADTGGQGGTAIYAKQGPLDTITGFADGAADEQGRVLTLEYEGFYLVNSFSPTISNGRERERKVWDNALLRHMMDLDERKPVISVGSFLVAHQEIDLANTRASLGFTRPEREAIGMLLTAGFVDTFRHCNPRVRTYTYWANQRMRQANSGFRFDYIFVSSRLAGGIRCATTHPDVTGSTNCPIELQIDL